MDGFGEMRINDTRQIQKWSYLQSVVHIIRQSHHAVDDLFNRALNETLLVSPTFYFSSPPIVDQKIIFLEAILPMVHRCGVGTTLR